MPTVKSHLRSLERAGLEIKSRKDYLRLDMNENPSGLPASFVGGILRNIRPERLAAYPEYDSLVRKLARHNRLKEENICLANGSDAAIKYIFDAYVSDKDRVLLTDPTFAMYPVYCSMFNAKPVIIPYDSVRAFPLKKFFSGISSSIKMAVIVNPNNPTGSVLPRAELIRVIRKAAQEDVLLIVDEAYFYFYPDTVIREVNRYRNLVVLRTFSKLCGMAGLRIGYAAAYPKIIRALRAVKPSFDVNSVGVLAAEGLLERPGLLNKMIDQVNEGKNYLAKKLEHENIGHEVSAANFVLIKCNGRAPEIRMRLAQENILVAAGFKQEILRDFIRVTAADKKMMSLFWEAFCKAWRHDEKKRIS